MKKFLMILALAPAMAFAAPMKKEAPARKEVGESKTLKPVAKANLKGLSIFASFDMTDSMSFDRSSQNQSQSGTFGSDKAFGFGAEYLLKTLDNGIGLQAGGTFEMGRTISNEKVGGATGNYTGAKPEVQLWTVYGQAVALLTPEIGVFGGANYTIPQVKNIPGGTWKGKIGYQVGATYMYSETLAIDGIYRTLNFNGSVDNQGVSTSYGNISVQGFAFRGRYLF